MVSECLTEVTSATNAAMFRTQNDVTPGSSVAVIAMFGLGKDALNGPLAYTGDSFSYRMIHSKLGRTDYRLTDII